MTDFSPDFEGPAAYGAGFGGDPSVLLGVILVAALIGAVAWITNALTVNAQQDRLKRIRERKYEHVKIAADRARIASDETIESEAQKLWTACSTHLGPAVPGGGLGDEAEKLLGKLKKAADGGDIDSPRIKVAKVDRSRMLEPAQGGYLHPRSPDVFVVDEDPVPPSQQKQRRERARAAVNEFHAFWVGDGQAAGQRAARLAELERLQAALAITVPDDPTVARVWASQASSGSWFGSIFGGRSSPTV